MLINYIHKYFKKIENTIILFNYVSLLYNLILLKKLPLD